MLVHVSIPPRRRQLKCTCCRNPNHTTLIPIIHGLLSSQDPKDAISEQMAELVGFDDLDLTMELLDKRELYRSMVSSVYFTYSTRREFE